MTSKLVRTFTIQLRSARSKVSATSSSSFQEIQKLLSDGTASKHGTAQKHVVAFLWVDRKTQARTRVEDEDAFKRFVSEMRTKLVDDLSAEETEELRELSKDKERLGELDDDKEERLTKLLTTEQEVIPVTGDSPEDSRGHPPPDEYDPERIRLERLQRLRDEEERARGEKRAKDPGETVKWMTLRFPQEKEETVTGKGHVKELSGLSYEATWEEACAALTRRFERIVHFRYQTDKKTWRDVRSPEAWARFRLEMGAEWAQQGAVTGVAEVQLVPFGTGALPMLQRLEDIAVLSFTHDVVKSRMKVMPLLAQCITDEAGAAAAARELVQSKEGAPDEQDDMGRTPLHLASIRGHHVLAEALLSAHSTVRAEMVKSRDHLGRTPLHYAKTEAVAKALLQGKADPRIEDGAGCTPLHTVVDADVCNVLLRSKKGGGVADPGVNAVDKAGMSPLLSHVLHTNRSEVVQLLVEKASGLLNSDEQPINVDLRAEDKFGRTALHHAASCNNYTAIQILLRSGQVDLNAVDRYGMTPLHIAASSDHIKTVSCLINQLADVTIRDACGRTAADLAHAKGIKRLLVSSIQMQRVRSQ